MSRSQIVITSFVVAIYGLPALLVATPLILWPSLWLTFVTLLVAPLVYAVGFVLVAGLLSQPFQSAIVPGTFPRDLTHPVYGPRRLYGLCWTSVYYCKPVYYIALTLPWLKRIMFRLFGYRGSMDFTVYPDTWIRDLPLLDFGAGTYVANRATIGTNMCLRDGTIVVDRIKTGERSLVGHLSMLAPGVVLENDAEVAVGCAVGIGARVGEGALVNTRASLNHYSSLGAGARLDNHGYLGLKAKVGPGLKLHPCSIVPPRARILTQDEADSLLSSNTAPGNRAARAATIPSVDSVAEAPAA